MLHQLDASEHVELSQTWFPMGACSTHVQVSVSYEALRHDLLQPQLLKLFDNSMMVRGQLGVGRHERLQLGLQSGRRV